jgi:hypothetical protein
MVGFRLALRDTALLLMGACLLGWAMPAWAADEEASSEGADSAGEEAPEAPASESAEDIRPETDLVARAELANSPEELPDQTYYFVGLRYRGIVVPKFMISLFADGGRTVYVNGVGPEFAIRKDNFEYGLSLWWANYRLEETPFKAKTDPDYAYEFVESKMKAIYVTSDFLWSQPLHQMFALNYGLGAGLGFVYGDLYRTEAYRDDSSGKLRKCEGPGLPASEFVDCDPAGNKYGGYKEPGWGDGGSKPALFPWLVLQTGLRFKPHRNFVARLDGGFGTSGFFWGLGADYGF